MAVRRDLVAAVAPHPVLVAAPVGMTSKSSLVKFSALGY